MDSLELIPAAVENSHVCRNAALHTKAMPLNHHNVNSDLRSYDFQSPLGAAHIKVCSAGIDSIITNADLRRIWDIY